MPPLPIAMLNKDIKEMQYKYSLNEKHQFLGLWTDPEEPHKKVVGLLKYDPDEGITLELEESFKRQSNSYICGIASGTKITIINSFATEWNGSEFNYGLEYSPSLLIIEQIFIGYSFNDLDDLEIQSCLVKTSDVKIWSGISGFETIIPSMGTELSEIDLKYRLRDAIDIYKSPTDNISLHTKLTIPEDFPNSEEIGLTETQYFEFEGMENYNSYSKHIELICKFMSFSMRCNINVEYVQLEINDSYVSHIQKKEPINLAFNASEKKLLNMFYCYSRSKDSVSNYYGNWIKFYESCTDFIDLYFYNQSKLTSDLFLRTVQSLEEMHRHRNEGTNRCGFKRRISSLFEEFDFIMKRAGNKEIFSQLVLDHRAYYTHWFKKKRDKLLKKNEIDYLLRDANLLLELCILKVFGMSEQEITFAIMHCQDYQLYLHWESAPPLSTPPRPIKWDERYLTDRT